MKMSNKEISQVFHHVGYKQLANKHILSNGHNFIMMLENEIMFSSPDPEFNNGEALEFKKTKIGAFKLFRLVRELDLESRSDN